MTDSEKKINVFATRVRQMILQFKDVKKENADLYAMVDERDAKIKQLETQLAQVKQDYNSLKMAKMLTITDGDLESAKARVAKLIREVDKCVTLLSEKQ